MEGFLKAATGLRSVIAPIEMREDIAKVFMGLPGERVILRLTKEIIPEPYWIGNCERAFSELLATAKNLSRRGIFVLLLVEDAEIFFPVRECASANPQPWREYMIGRMQIFLDLEIFDADRLRVVFLTDMRVKIDIAIRARIGRSSPPRY